MKRGDVTSLRRLLVEQPGLATARIDGQRTLLHIVADWPGHPPNGAQLVKTLADAGADVNAPFAGSHRETPLHWAASSDDVDVLDALLDAGADIEATGSVIGGGTALANARAFAMWRAAHRLVERGAAVTLVDAATLGLMDHVRRFFTSAPAPDADVIDRAFWGACHGGQHEAAEYLLGRGAQLNWIPPWERLTPIDAARRRGAHDLAEWLRSRGARSADDAVDGPG